MGVIPGGATAVNFMIEIPNRGKNASASTGHTGRREDIYELAKTSDVFLTASCPRPQD